AAQLRDEGQVAAHGHLVVEGRRVGQEPDAPPHLVRIARDVDAVHRHDAGRRQQDAPQHLEGRALPGAVQAQKADDLSSSDVEVQFGYGGVLAVVLRQASDFDHEISARQYARTRSARKSWARTDYSRAWCKAFVPDAHRYDSL